MHGLKTTFWLACALIWGFKGWQIVPPVFIGDKWDGAMAGAAFAVVVLSCLGSALEHVEKALKA